MSSIVGSSNSSSSSLEVFDHVYMILDHDLTGLSAEDIVSASKVCRLWEGVVDQLAGIYFQRLNRVFDISMPERLSRDECIASYIAVKGLVKELGCERIEELRDLDPFSVRQALVAKSEAYFKSLIPKSYKEDILRDLLPNRMSQYFFGDIQKTETDKSNEALSRFVFRHVKGDDPIKSEFPVACFEEIFDKFIDRVKLVILKIEQELSSDDLVQEFQTRFRGLLESVRDVAGMSLEDIISVQNFTVKGFIMICLQEHHLPGRDSVYSKTLGAIFGENIDDHLERFRNVFWAVLNTRSSSFLGYLNQLVAAFTGDPLVIIKEFGELRSHILRLIEKSCTEEVKSLEKLWLDTNTVDSYKNIRLLEQAIFEVNDNETASEVLDCDNKFYSHLDENITHPTVVQALVKEDLLSFASEPRAYKTIMRRSLVRSNISRFLPAQNPFSYLYRCFHPATRNLTCLASVPLKYEDYQRIKHGAPHVEISQTIANYAKTIEELKRTIMLQKEVLGRWSNFLPNQQLIQLMQNPLNNRPVVDIIKGPRMTALSRCSDKLPVAVNELEQALERKRKAQTIVNQMVSDVCPQQKLMRLGLLGIVPKSVYQRNR